MDAEQLFALATPRGVALDAQTLGSKATDGMGLSIADIANACYGLESRAWYAALYSLAGDNSCRPIIAEWLTASLVADRERYQWAGKCERMSGERTEFDEELVWLFLLDERTPSVLRVRPELKAFVLNVEEHVWRRVLAHQYQAIYAEYTDARLRAESHVKRRLRNE